MNARTQVANGERLHERLGLRVRILPGGRLEGAFRLRPFGVTPRGRLNWLLEALVYLELVNLNALQRQRLYELLGQLIDEATLRIWEAAPLPQRPGDVFHSFEDHPKRWKGLGRIAEETLKNARAEGRRVKLQRVVADDDPLDQLQQANAVVRQTIEAAASGKPRREPLFAGKREPGSFAEAAAVMALRLASQVPARSWRRCPYETNGSRCGRLFVGVTRETWCATHRSDARREQWRRGQQQRREGLRARRRGGKERRRRANRTGPRVQKLA